MSGDPPDPSSLQEALELNARLKEMERALTQAPDALPRATGGLPKPRSNAVGGYGGRTFTSKQELEIERNNAHLLDRLARVRGEVSAGSHRSGPPKVGREGSASINRRKRATAIESENARLLARIQGQKSTFSSTKPPTLKPKAIAGACVQRATGVQA